ncbi:hypothetical protein Tco_0791213 [Tanacetum coccineum]
MDLRWRWRAWRGWNLRVGISCMMEICFKKLRNLVELIYHLFPIWIVGFLEKFGGGFKQDIDDEEEEKWRG